MFSERRVAQFGLGATLALLVAAMAAIFTRPLFDQRPVAFAEPGNPAPYFKLHDPEGRFLSLDDLRGTIAVLYFTSVNCPQCATYNERIEKLARRYRNDSGVQFVAIDIDPHADPLQVRVDAKIVNRTFPTLMDDKCLAADAYSIKSTPEVAVIGPTGTLRYCGPFDDNAVESKVQHHYVADALGNLVASPELASAR